jgi:hypothetical protein
VSRGRQPFVLALVAAAVSVQAGAAAPLASGVSPARGAVVTPSPVFVAAVIRGDQPLEIQVATSPAVTAIGFRANVGFCFPVRSGRGRVRCTLGTALRNGTYYWTLLYQRYSRCQVVGGRRYCFPEPHLTAPTRFTVREAAPAPAP